MPNDAGDDGGTHAPTDGVVDLLLNPSRGAGPLPVTREQQLLQRYPRWIERLALWTLVAGALAAGWWVMEQSGWPDWARWPTVVCGLPLLWLMSGSATQLLLLRSWQRRRAPGTRVSDGGPSDESA